MRQLPEYLFVVLPFLMGLFLAPFSFVQAQALPASVDSLEAKLATASDTTRVRLLLDLSDRVLNHDLEQSRTYGETALAEARRLDLALEICRALLRIGWIQVHLGQRTEGKALSEEALAHAQEYDLPMQEAHAWRYLGWIDLLTYRYPQAIDAQKRALRLYEKVGDQHFTAVAHNDMGETYAALDNEAAALDHMNQALAIQEEIGSLSGMADVASSMGVYLHQQGHPDEALSSMQRALDLYRQIENPQRIAEMQREIGNSYLTLGRYDEAMAALLQSLALFEEIGNKDDLAWTLRHLGRLHRRQDNTAAALDYNLRSLDLGQENHMPALIQDASQSLSVLYEELGDYREALRHSRRYQAYHDSLTSEDQAREIGRIEAQYEFDKQQAAAEEEAQARQQRTLLLIIVFAGLGILALLGGLLYLRTIRRKNAIVSRQAAELRRAHALKDHFLANISHEFRTPLTLTFAPLNDLLTGRFSVDPEAHPLLERARTNGRRLLRLINQLLDLSRLDAGSLTLYPQRHDLVAFIRQRVAAFESLALDRRLTLRFLPSTATLPCSFDAEKLETVLLNLLSNAVKFTPEGGTILVEVRQNDAGQPCLTVRDTGIGIAPEHLLHLFDRFYQADSSTTRAQEGTGIGLALVKQLVELHGGAITVESEVGTGTTFTITLPPILPEVALAGAGLAEIDGAPLVTPPVHLPSRADAVLADILPHTDATLRLDDTVDEEATVVLIVEDNADMRAYLRAHLDGLYHVEEASNGAAGLERAVALVPDLVMSDVMMPEMDGFALLAALKTDPRTSHVPVVLLTAKADAESKITGLETGADDYLAKPFDAMELRARVQNLIDSRRRLRETWSRQMPALTPDDIEVSTMETVFLNQVRDAIEENIADAGFGVEALAEAVQMSPRQLRRKLRSLLDEPPNELIRRFRLERAASLLEQNAGSVKEVAFAVGFGSVSRFGVAFRAIYGVPPSQYAPAPEAGA